MKPAVVQILMVTVRGLNYSYKGGERMKKRWNKLIALLMLSCMVTASFPMCQAHAEEIPAVVTDENETTERSNQDMQEENADENEENNEENVDQDNGEETETLEENEQSEESSTTDEESENSEEITTSSEETFADSVIEKNKDRINYVFVESPYLESPGTERIAVSYGEGTENIQNLSITVESSDGDLEVWDSAENVSNLYLFEKEYTDDSQAGTYSVIGLNLTDELGTHEVKLSDYDMEALFGVNEKYEGIDRLVPLDEESEDAQIEDQEELTYGATVVQINSENPNESVQEIEDALENAEENTDISSTTSSVSVASAISDEVQSIANSSKSGNIVVALDPGHDSKHTGATGIGGLKEEVLTLKIANYCKEELEKYAGVSVYMTRTTASCPYPSNKSSGGDIGDRVQAAAKAGADLFVSFHLNSSSSSSSNGAEVIVPNGNWKPQVASDGRKLAQAILNELKAVGVNMRPTSIYSRDTTINETYPDGSKSDYFSVQIYAKEAGIPGIIVEHAFLTNSNDVNKFLKTESGLKKLGCADATGIAKYLGLSKKSDNTGWRTINGKTYYYINGKAVTGERQIDGHWYYFDANGIMQTGFVNLGYKIVYYNYNGWMLYGEHQLNGYWYYFDTGTGAMQTGFVNLGHKIVYYNAKGQMQYGEHQLNGYWYYFDTGTGAMQTGFVNLGHKIVYYNTEGQMQYGEHQINGYWYYFDTGSGAMQTGFVNLGHKIVYYNAEGQMQYGEQQIDGYWYYFDTGSGAMQKNAEINGKYYDADGKYQELHKIMNDPTTSVEKMVRYYRNRNLSYPSEKLAVGGADSIEKLANIFYEEATAEGIDPAIAWCQTMKETNWLRYGGQVKIEQFNFAGIGATDGGASGADFSSYGKNGVRMGVRAQMQHLKAYAVKGISKNDLKYECVDPRFKYVNKGSAMYVEWLGINENPNGSGWATAPKYGYSIMNDYVKNLWKL